ncbi:alpha-1,6-mannosyl-glycoprotein 2-beta-N-acetylglucosaminyltransferase-like [Cylas formicarius]|uniref:alpha-1,6-mannosyl-glycoprotein 2-beta-N-acetylglucosaminyltransferase-like n=1 Tax=Cylas formicarius TaxID=197179 RepID=UPI0029585982|nr:alpha-1,6-mannosyl-glycoprotein 2-beta-N-acetylglucosaminyltransferase-like [Cylas formicarius]
MTVNEKWKVSLKLSRPRTTLMLLLFVSTLTVFLLLLDKEENNSDGTKNFPRSFDIAAHTPASFDASAVNFIKARIGKYNSDQVILNADLYGSLKDDAVVIVIQMHDRIDYLRRTIDSLSKVRFISNALLVFSHDHYDDDINLTVQAINFTRVLQIFYPHSIQTHPNEFPGQSPLDCPKDIKIPMALQIGCANAKHPDPYGHYRDYKLTQLKHHWWWKINVVFNHLAISKTHGGMFLFIEDDHYVVEDAIHMLKIMETTSEREDKRCGIFSLGEASEKRGYKHESRARDDLDK